MKNVLFLLFILPLLSWANTQSHFIIFGDSLSDAAPLTSSPGTQQKKGNNFWVEFCANYQGNPSVCPHPYLTGAPISDLNTRTGQQANRVNWTIYLEQQMNSLPLATYWQIKQAHNRHKIFANNNLSFAFASAESGAKYVSDLHGSHIELPYNPYNTSCTGPGKDTLNGHWQSCVPGVYQQINDYLSFTNLHVANRQDTYIIWAGANDLFDNIGKVLYLAKQKEYGSAVGALITLTVQCHFGSSLYFSAGHTHPILFSCAANNVANDVRLLLQKGADAHNIYVLAMPDLSLAPEARMYPAWITTGVAKAFNSAIANRLGSSGVHLFPAFASFDRLVNHAASYGFINNDNSCVATHHYSPAINACNKYFFYNGKHPTGHAGQCIASSVANFMTCSRHGGKNCAAKHFMPLSHTCSLKS